MKTKKLEILKSSLERKKETFQNKLNNHYNDVKMANGQPLNDKKNGQSTLNRWEKQNNTLRNLDKSIERTQNAIEREESKIRGCECIKSNLPIEILNLLESGELNQWSKYPHIFFVGGVDKARIIYEKGKVYHKYSNALTDKEQRKKFAHIYNELSAKINK